MSKILRVLKYFFFFGVLFFVISALAIVFDGLIDNIKKSDAIVILGNKVERTGEPSVRLANRLDRGAELYKVSIAPLIIVTGAVGIEGFDEAKVMKEYLVQKGIPENAIIVDSQGGDTFASSKNTKKILEEKNLDSVLVVSSYYHISRTVLAFKKSDIEEVHSAHGVLNIEMRDVYSIPREVLGFYYYLFRNYSK